jgi:hypothetical protein
MSTRHQSSHHGARGGWVNCNASYLGTRVQCSSLGKLSVSLPGLPTLLLTCASNWRYPLHFFR